MEYQEFVVEKLFKITLGFPVHKNQIKESFNYQGENLIPYVTRTSNNNGVEFYVRKEDFSPKKINEGNVIIIGAEGLIAFYQEQNFITGNKINILENKNLNKYNAIYINTILNHEISGKFNYGRAIVQGRLKKLKIRLPSKGYEPDWLFMEDYIKRLDKKKYLSKEKDSFSKPLTGNKKTLKDKKWSYFNYKDIFKIEKGYYNKRPLEKGDLIFVSASRENNGITDCLNPKVVEKIFEGNCITIVNNGESRTESFYQDEKFTCSHDINIVRLRDKEMNKYNAMFLITLIKKEKYRFNYGRKWRIDRMKKSVIKLPVNSEEKPDWEFMENYIKSLNYSSTL